MGAWLDSMAAAVELCSVMCTLDKFALGLAALKPGRLCSAESCVQHSWCNDFEEQPSLRLACGWFGVVQSGSTGGFG